MQPKDLIDKIVVVTHPYMHHGHVIAKVIEATAKTVVLHSWHPKNGWEEDRDKRRRADAVVVVLGTDATMDPAAITLAQERLRSFKSEAEDREKKAWASYWDKVKELGEPVRAAK